VVVGVGGAGSGAEARTQRKNSFFFVDWNGPGDQSTGFGVATNCHANGDKKEEKKKVMSFYLRAGGACFLYTHCQALPAQSLCCFRRCVAQCKPARCPPARCRSSEVPFR